MDHGLGEFLRARRELVTPADVGLPPGNGLRRVPGLRREEVALLAGISAEYYLRLEQGRDRSPSAQVVSALARVLRLDADASAHLMALAHPESRRRPSLSDRVPAGVAMLLEGLNVPAFVINRYHDILVANPLARALSPLVAPGVNWLRVQFADPAARVFDPLWSSNAELMVAQLRARAGVDPSDTRLQELITELTAASPVFQELWNRHEVRRGSGVTTVIRHAVVGEMKLLVEKFAVVGAEELEAVLMHAAPGSTSEAALTELREARTPTALHRR